MADQGEINRIFLVSKKEIHDIEINDFAVTVAKAVLRIAECRMSKEN